MQCKLAFVFTANPSPTYSKRSLSWSMMPLCCSARENPIESSSSCAAWHDGVSREFADTQLLMSALTSEDCARCSESAPPPTITPTARAAVFCCMLSARAENLLAALPQHREARDRSQVWLPATCWDAGRFTNSRARSVSRSLSPTRTV